MKSDGKKLGDKKKKEKASIAFSLDIKILEFDIKILNLDLKSSKEILDLKIGNLN